MFMLIKKSSTLRHVHCLKLPTYHMVHIYLFCSPTLSSCTAANCPQDIAIRSKSGEAKYLACHVTCKISKTCLESDMVGAVLSEEVMT